MNSKISFSVVAISLLLGLALATEDNEGTVDEEQHTVDFSYTGPKGPSNWGKLKPEFSACSSGKNQSPVNIIKNDVVLNKNLKPLSGNYASVANATLIRSGHNIGLQYDGNIGSLVIDGKKYSFKQMHWHSPSEHLIDGRRYPAEVHLVHEAEDLSAAVIAILFKYSDSTEDVDPLLPRFSEGLKKLSTEKHENKAVVKVAVGKMNTKLLTRRCRKYYRYIGSFTTPPCTENVIWTVLAKVRSISKEEVKALKAPMAPEYKDNARPAQQLNGRKIELYDEHK